MQNPLAYTPEVTQRSIQPIGQPMLTVRVTAHPLLLPICESVFFLHIHHIIIIIISTKGYHCLFPHGELDSEEAGKIVFFISADKQSPLIFTLPKKSSLGRFTSDILVFLKFVF